MFPLVHHSSSIWSPVSERRVADAFYTDALTIHAFPFDALRQRLSNTGAAIPGIVGVALTGFILDSTGSWSLVFSIAIFFYILGTIVYNIFGTGEKVF